MRPAPFLLVALLVAPTVLALDPVVTTQTLIIRISGTTGDFEHVSYTLPSASQATCSTSDPTPAPDFYVTLRATVSCTLRTRDCTPIHVTASHPVDDFPEHFTETTVSGQCGGNVSCTSFEGVPCTNAALAVTSLTRTYRCASETRWVAQTNVFAEWSASCSLRVV